MATQLKLNQLQQEGASTNQVIAWNGSTWAPATNGTGTVTSVAATQPAAGLTISGSPITTSGTLTFALANDLAGLEGLSSTGLAVRTGDGTWTTRSIAYASGEGMPFTVNISDATGVSGNPTIQIVNTPNTFKGAVKAATTANITLSGAQTIDGVSVVSGDRVLVKNQSSSINNGIYKVQSGSWLRSSDAGTDLGLANGTLVYVANGTTNAATYWKQDTPNPTVGSSNIVYSQVFASSADGNGIYSGSGNISSAAVATVGSGSTFAISYNNGTANALRVEDNSGVELESDDGTNTFQVLDSAISATANSGSGGLLTLNDTSASIGTSSTGVYIDTTAISLTTDAAKIYGDSTSTVGELHFQEATTNGANYIGFKAPTALSGNSTYTLPSSSSDGLMINSSSTLSWGTATNSHLSSGVGGIYKGSGIIPSGTSAKLTTSGSFEVTYSNTSTAFVADDTTSGAALQSRTNAHSIYVDDTQVGLSAPHTLLNSFASNAQELRFEEPAGINYTAFKAQNQSVDITYTLPAAAPASNGYVLSSTTGGTMSWVANGGADGNGIYSGSGTIATAAVATIGSGSTFTIDWSDATNALHFADTAGTYQLNDKTGSNGVYGTSTTSELFSNEYYVRVSATGGGTDTNAPFNISSGHLSMSSVLSPAQITSNQNNYGPSGLDTANVLRLSSDASRNITGITTASATKVPGWILTIHNIGSFDIVLKNEDSNSTAAYRFALGADVTIGAGRSHTLIYDNTSSRWRSFVTDTTGSGSGITTLNTLTASTQTFATGTTGTDFNISSSSSTHTFNIPSASASARGLVTTGTQTFGGLKSFPSNIELGLSIVTPGSITMYDGANNNTLQITVPELPASWQFVFPTNNGDNGQVLTTNGSGVTSWTTVGAGSGDVAQGGNSYGASMIIGTNDNNTLSFETNGVTRATITSGASTGGQMTLTEVTANTATVSDILTLRTNSTGTAAASFGNAILFQAESSTTDNQDLARLAAYWTTATHASRAGAFSFQLGTNGGALTEIAKLDRTNGLQITYSDAAAKGFYQSGASTTNNFVGRTSFGTTSLPNASALIDMVTTSLGFGLPAMTSTQRDAISSPRQGLAVYNTTNDKISVRRSSDWVDVAPDLTILNAQTGTSYTLVIGDAGKMVTLDNASSITLTVPTNASVAFPIGTNIDIVRKGAGSVTVSSSATIRSADGYSKLRVQYSSATLTKIATDEWLLIGDLSA